jgi:ribA/ribD-fused uncharacterized protein
MVIHFKTPEHKFLSNFALVEVDYNGLKYPSVEHAYQSAKSDEQYWKLLCQSKLFTPGEVKKKSRTDIRIKIEWPEIKLQVMEECLISKFKQQPFRDQLLATGNQNIQEGNWHNDTFWGVDLNNDPNVGENHLGRLLMKLRDQINAGLL